MPDIDNKSADQGNAGGENGNAGADEKKPADTGADNGGTGAGEGGGDDDKGDAGDNPAKPNAKSPDSKPPIAGEDDDQEPTVKKRLTAKDHIIQRLQRKAKKNAAGAADNGGEADDEEDGEIAPEDVETIQKVVSPMLAPVLETAMATEDDKEVRDFLKENPDFAPFEAKARKFMKHPTRRHLPIETIFFEVAGKGLLKIGADRQKKADEDAKNSQTGGGGNRGGDGEIGVWELTPEQFAAKQQALREGK